MNELNLFFDENELIRLYKINLDTSKKIIWRSFIKNTLITITVFIAGIILFGIGLYYRAFIPFSIALCIMSFLLLIYLIVKLVSTRKALNKIFAFPTDYIERYNNIEKVKYIYDDQIIKRLEDENEQVFKWQALKSIDNDENSIHVCFFDSAEQIWIPKKMTVEEELLEFEMLLDTLCRKFERQR